MISKTGIHALTALASLAELPPGAYAGAAEIAAGIGAPPNYLGKLLRTLADAGLVQSQKGKGGGFRLARSPAAISLFQAMDPIEHVGRWAGCFLGRARCSPKHPCPVHQRWQRVRQVYLKFLQETTIADLTRGGAPRARQHPSVQKVFGRKG
jgi:Rrf2 family protein